MLARRDEINNEEAFFLQRDSNIQRNQSIELCREKSGL